MVVVMVEVMALVTHLLSRCLIPSIPTTSPLLPPLRRLPLLPALTLVLVVEEVVTISQMPTPLNSNNTAPNTALNTAPNNMYPVIQHTTNNPQPPLMQAIHHQVPLSLFPQRS